MSNGTARVRFRFLLALLALVTSLLGGPALAAPVLGSQQPPRAGPPDNERQNPPAYVPGELIVKYRPQAGIASARSTEERHGLRRIRQLALDSYSLVEVPPGQSAEQAAALLRQDPAVESAEPNAYRSIAFVPNDREYPSQWNFAQVQAQAAWEVTRGAGVVVAVLDTGVAYEDYQHYRQAPDLANTTFVDGWDFVNNDAHPNDDHGHGTHVAGTIAQSTNNGTGTAGLAFEASLMPVKVMDARGQGSCAIAAEGIKWAVDNGADIINISFGGSATCTAEREALDHAAARGVTVVAAAGNAGQGTVDFPAALEGVIAVGAVDAGQTRTYYSNYGQALDLMAPGGDLNADRNGDGLPDGVLQETFCNPAWDAGACAAPEPATFKYYALHGTSMATPHVTAAAALLIASGGATTPAAVRAALTETARDLEPAGWDPSTGHGLVQIRAALDKVAAPIGRPSSLPYKAYLPLTVTP